MSKTSRAFVVLTTTLALLSAMSGTGWAATEHNVTTYVVKDHQEKGRSHLDIEWVSGDTINHHNSAYAVADGCTGCRAVAVAIQVVMVTGSPSQVYPKNEAIAVNYECTSCGSLALAHQFVMSTRGVMELSDEAEDRIESIEEDIEVVVESVDEGAGLATIEEQVSALVGRLRQVLSDELERSRQSGEIRYGRDEDRDDD